MKVSRKTRRDAKIYEYDGKAMTLIEWARELNVSVRCLHQRMARGWTGSKLFSRDQNKERRDR